MKAYELTYIITPEITSEEAEGKVKEIETFIHDKGGTVTSKTNPVPKTLAYQVGKSASGFLGVLDFEAEPESVLEIKNMLAKDSKILRHMEIIKKAARPEKHARTRKPAEPEKAQKTEEPATLEHAAKTEKPKVELKDIEQTLDELLGE